MLNIFLPEATANLLVTSTIMTTGEYCRRAGWIWYGHYFFRICKKIFQSRKKAVGKSLKLPLSPEPSVTFQGVQSKDDVIFYEGDDKAWADGSRVNVALYDGDDYSSKSGMAKTEADEYEESLEQKNVYYEDDDDNNYIDVVQTDNVHYNNAS